jgi:hypothetical protein
MAGHGESHGHHESSEKGKKHGSWLEKMKKGVGWLGLGTLGANYMLAMSAGVVFPPYILAAATGAAFYHVLGGAPAKKGHH